MKIYFCDECNQSIPLPDIKANRITIDSGKIYCHACAPKPPRRAELPMRAWMILAGALLFVAVGMGVMAVWGDRIFRRDEQQSLAQRIDGMERRLQQMRDDLVGRLERIEGDLQEGAPASGSPGKFARLSRAIDDDAAALRQFRNLVEASDQELKGRLDALTASLEAAGGRWEADLSRLDRAVSQNLVEDIQRLHAMHEEARDRQRLMESRIANIEELSSGLLKRSAEVETDAALKEEKPLSPAAAKALEEALTRMKSTRPNERYSGVMWFMENDPPIRTRKGEQALVERLDDPSDYVVSAAIASLAWMNAAWTFPHLVEKLNSDNEFIFEAALEAVEKISGQKTGLTSGTERATVVAKVRELQTWWRENRARLEGS